MNTESSPSSQSNLWEVALNIPLPDTFTYQAPDDLKIQAGDPVKVPFGAKNKKVSGLVVGPTTKKEGAKEFKTKNISEIDSEKVPLNPTQINWLKWIADYYIYPLGQVQQSVFPPLKKNSNRKKNNAHNYHKVSKVFF